MSVFSRSFVAKLDALCLRCSAFCKCHLKSLNPVSHPHHYVVATGASVLMHAFGHANIEVVAAFFAYAIWESLMS